MNPTVHDRAIEAVRARLSGIRGVTSVVLFGSAARGSATPESDIDLLIRCDPRGEADARSAIHEVSDELHVRIAPLFYRPDDLPRFDSQFLESIARHGRALLGDPPRFAVSDLDLQPLRLISYRLRRQSPARRARLLRLLDGYRTEKRVGRKRYRSEGKGLLGAVGGWRLGRGAIVVPEEAVESVIARGRAMLEQG